jgi:hypothetical protein
MVVHLKGPHVEDLFLRVALLAGAVDLLDVGPTRRSLGHWERAQEGPVGLISSFSLLLPG